MKRISVTASAWGIILFVGLYFIATRYYPGGSQFHQQQAGFSWSENYWCNLLNEQAINGMPNPARPIALFAMFILSVSLSVFWWQFPMFTSLADPVKWTIRATGVSAMMTGFLLVTGKGHDMVTNLASALGLIAMAGTFIGLYRNRWMPLFFFGLFNILLVVVNNILYYDPSLIVHLPVVQKITFASFLAWVVLINIKILQTPDQLGRKTRGTKAGDN